MKKYIFPWILVLGGLVVICYFNWQIVVGLLMMLIGGYIHQRNKEAEGPGLPKYKNPPKPPQK